MATAAQLAANRINSKKSTGPRSAEGKARASRNATKHGLSGRGVAPIAEDEALLEQRHARWLEDLNIATDLESVLVAEAAAASVRMRRVDITERERSDRRRVRSLARRQAKSVAQKGQSVHDVAFWEEAIRFFDESADIVYETAEILVMPAPGFGPADAKQAFDAWDMLFNSMEPAPPHAAPMMAEALRKRRDAAANPPVETLVDPDPNPAAWLDPSPVGERLRRYRAASERTFHRALARLERLRRLPASPQPNEPDPDDQETPCDESPCFAEQAADHPPEPPPAAEMDETPARNEPNIASLATTYIEPPCIVEPETSRENLPVEDHQPESEPAPQSHDTPAQNEAEGVDQAKIYVETIGGSGRLTFGEGRSTDDRQPGSAPLDPPHDQNEAENPSPATTCGESASAPDVPTPPSPSLWRPKHRHPVTFGLPPR